MADVAQDVHHDPAAAAKTAPIVLPASVLPRPHVMAALDRATRARVCLLLGVPGTGRTTTLVLWHGHARAHGADVAWLTVDEGDANHHRLARHLVACLGLDQTVLSSDEADKADESADDHWATPIVTALTRAVGQSGPRWLVIDDADLVVGTPGGALLRDLISYAPHDLHLVISARSPRGLVTRTTAAGGDVTDLDAADLAFKAPEIQTLLRDAGLPAAPVEAQRVVRRTGGLPLAVAAALRTGEPTTATYDDLITPQRAVDAVLATLSPQTCEFVMQVSIVDLVSGPLAHAITGRPDAPALLRTLAADGFLLVASHSDRTWYQFTPVVQASLERLRRDQLDDEEVVRLRKRAADWLYESGSFLRAAKQALLAGDTESGADLLRRSIRRLYAGEVPDAVLPLAAAIPDETVETNPYANLLVAAMYLFRDPWDEAAAPYLRRAERLAQCTGQDTVSIVASLTATLRLPQAFYDGDTIAASRYAQDAMRPTDDELEPARLTRETLEAAVLPFSAMLALWAGHVDEATEQLERASTVATSQGFVLLAALCRVHRIAARAAVGRASAELPVLLRTVAEFDEAGWSRHYEVRSLHATIAWAQLRAYRLDEARVSLERARSGHDHLGLSLDIELQLLETEIALADGDVERARAHLNRARSTSRRIRGPQPSFRGRLAVREARVAFAENDLDALDDVFRARALRAVPHLRIHQAHLLHLHGRHRLALEALAPLTESRITELFPETYASAHLEEARIRHDLAEGPNALRSLRSALLAAKGHDVVRPFVEHASWSDRLLRERFAEDPDFAEQVAEILVAETRHVLSTRRPSRTDALTDTEREILVYLAGGSTLKTVAQRRQVSLNTIKTQVATIYRKLAVPTRSEAVRVAQQHGIVGAHVPTPAAAASDTGPTTVGHRRRAVDGDAPRL